MSTSFSVDPDDKREIRRQHAHQWLLAMPKWLHILYMHQPEFRSWVTVGKQLMRLEDRDVIPMEDMEERRRILEELYVPHDPGFPEGPLG